MDHVIQYSVRTTAGKTSGVISLDYLTVTLVPGSQITCLAALIRMYYLIIDLDVL